MNLNVGFFCDKCKNDCSAPNSFFHSKKDTLGLDFCKECFASLLTLIEFDYFYRPHAIEHTKREWEKMQKEWHCVACKDYLGGSTKWNVFSFLSSTKSSTPSSTPSSNLTSNLTSTPSSVYHICENCSDIDLGDLVSSLFVFVDGSKNLIEMKSGEICDFTFFPDNEHIRMKPVPSLLKILGENFTPKQEFVKEWYNLCYEIVYLSPKFNDFGPLAGWIPLMKPTVLPGTNSKYLIAIENSSLKNRIASCVIDDKRHVYLQILFNSYEEYDKCVDVEEIIKKLKYVT